MVAMLITNFRLKYVLYKIVCGAYQLVDTGRIHPVRQRALRALERSVDYIESAMPDALGLENQRELIDYSLRAVGIDGHYLEFGVFTGGTIRYIARQIGARTIHGFDSFEGLPEAWSGFGLGGKFIGDVDSYYHEETVTRNVWAKPRAQPYR